MINKIKVLLKAFIVFALVFCVTAGSTNYINYCIAHAESTAENKVNTSSGSEIKNSEAGDSQSDENQQDSKAVELPDNFLKADGKVLRDHAGTGEVVTLRGTNIGGWQVMEAWMCPTNASDQKTAIQTLIERFGVEKAEELLKVYENAWVTEQDFDNLKALNFNAVRLPISCYNLLDEEGKLRSDTLARLDWFVEECGKRGIYVILDLHAAPGSQNGRDHSGDKSGSVLFTDETSQYLTRTLWEQLAQHYKGNPSIAGYDLLNEPEGSESERYPWGRVQLPFLDQLYKAIRAIDPDHIIIFNSVWEPTNMPDPSKYGWENVMYEYHYYCWDGTDDARKQRSFTDSKVKNDASAGFQVPVLIGEFTLFDKLNSWKYALDVYEENGWSWTTWTYKTVDQGNWGIYNSTTGTTPKVNIVYDSEETIRNKWGKVTTSESFAKNKYLYDLLRVEADQNASVNEIRKWYQNADIDEASLRAGTDATADIVSSGETSSTVEESKVICLTVSGTERTPTTTSRNVCISPAVRASVNVTGMEYLLFDTYSSKSNQALFVTLVDKTGATWSGYTSSLAMPSAYQWERVFLDLTKADIDTTAIIEIRIGANYPGTYYFDNIYFAQSYGDPLPDETVEEMQQDMGMEGSVIDWENIPVSSEIPAVSNAILNADNTTVTLSIAVMVVIIGAILIYIMKFRKRKVK